MPPGAADFDLLDPAFFAAPHALFARLRAHAPVWRVPGTRVHLVSSWALVEQALGRVADFSNHLTGLLIRGPQGQLVDFEMAGTGTALDAIATADDPEHALHRRSVQPLLAAGRVAALEPWIRAQARAALEPLVARGAADWMCGFAHPLPTRVVARLIGLPASDLDALMRWALHGGEMLAGTTDLARMAELGCEAAAHAAYLEGQLARALADPSHAADRDLLGALAGAVRSGALPAQVAVAILVILVGAGAETTTTLIGSAALRLAECPALQARLRAQPAALPVFVEEVLRLDSPFNGHYREVRRACALGGVPLAAGDRLLLLWAAANRDPAVFDDPDALDLARPNPRAHLAFGRGVHFCVGAALARLEARVVLEELLSATRWIALAASHRPPEWVPSLFMHRLAHLDLAFEPA